MPSVAPRFQVGQRVRARNINPVESHAAAALRARQDGRDRDAITASSRSRIPTALSLGEKPQHVYSVRFAARELWGEQASPRDSVYIDMWDDYLEPA